MALDIMGMGMDPGMSQLLDLQKGLNQLYRLIMLLVQLSLSLLALTMGMGLDHSILTPYHDHETRTLGERRLA